MTTSSTALRLNPSKVSRAKESKQITPPMRPKGVSKIPGPGTSLRRQTVVSWHVGSEVVGLLAEPGAAAAPPRVVGVQVARAGGGLETRRADRVVDASGRRSGIRQWLAAIGAGPVEQEEMVSGIFYSSRFYRLRWP